MTHRWDHDKEQRIAAQYHEAGAVVLAFPDGNARNIRVCAKCAMKKITVIPAQPWLAWHEWEDRWGKRWRTEKTPPCDGGLTGEGGT